MVELQSVARGVSAALMIGAIAMLYAGHAEAKGGKRLQTVCQVLMTEKAKKDALWEAKTFRMEGEQACPKCLENDAFEAYQRSFDYVNGSLTCWTVDPKSTAGSDPNEVEIKKHLAVCTAPIPTANKDDCDRHCKKVRDATASCAKECHGNKGCEGMCAGICKPERCEAACAGAENERSKAYARQVLDVCRKKAPDDKSACHKWCDDEVKKSHDECVKRSHGLIDDECHSVCNVDGCHKGCNGHADPPKPPKAPERERRPPHDRD